MRVDGFGVALLGALGRPRTVMASIMRWRSSVMTISFNAGEHSPAEGLPSTILTASQPQQKRGGGLCKTSHRVSGLVQRDVSRKTCGINWIVRDILDTDFSWKRLAA
jgi:hypothetical protein